MNRNDEILNFVTQPKNLPATLDIIERAAEIRNAALSDCWDSIWTNLKDKIPRRLSKMRFMKWDFWSRSNRPDDTNRLLYYYDARLDNSDQYLSYAAAHYFNKRSYQLYY